MARQTKLIAPRIGVALGSVSVQVRDVLWGLVVKDLVHEQTLVRERQTDRHRQTERQRQTQTDRQTRETDRDRQTETEKRKRQRQRDKQTERQTDRQTERQRQRDGEKDANIFWSCCKFKTHPHCCMLQEVHKEYDSAGFG